VLQDLNHLLQHGTMHSRGKVDHVGRERTKQRASDDLDHRSSLEDLVQMRRKLREEPQELNAGFTRPRSSAIMPAWTAAATLHKRGGNPFHRWTERYCHLSAGGEILTTRERAGAPIHKTYKVAEVRAHPSARRRLIFVLKDGGEVHAQADTAGEVESFVGVARAGTVGAAYTGEL